MVENQENTKNFKSTAYICRQRGSNNFHYKTIVPRGITRQQKLDDKCEMEWIPYGKEYIVRFKE